MIDLYLERVIGVFLYNKQPKAGDNLMFAWHEFWWMGGNDEGGICQMRIKHDCNLSWAKKGAPPDVPGSDASVVDE